MRPAITPEAEALIGQKLPVLDKGHVLLLDVMGSDAAVVQAARTSYGAGTKTVREDKGLINYLMRNDHASPFEMVSLKFHIKLPIFVFAQMVRHRTAKLNAMSARYSEMPDEFYEPHPDEWRGQDTVNKQGSAGFIQIERVPGDPMTATDCFPAYVAESYRLYQGMLRQGVAREQARMALPQNLYTEIVWKCDLRNLLNFLRLRLDWHAQQEIRVYAEAMAQCAKAVAPLCYEAFEEHVQHGRRFSRSEVAVLREWVDRIDNEFGPGTAEADAERLTTEKQALEMFAKLDQD